jgi:hypothetical protein
VFRRLWERHVLAGRDQLGLARRWCALLVPARKERRWYVWPAAGGLAVLQTGVP